jgi:hypothetical protein
MHGCARLFVRPYQARSKGMLCSIMIHETDLCINTSLEKLSFSKYIPHLTHNNTLLFKLVTTIKAFGNKNLRIRAGDNLSRFAFECSTSMCSRIKNLMMSVKIINIGNIMTLPEHPYHECVRMLIRQT